MLVVNYANRTDEAVDRRLVRRVARALEESHFRDKVRSVDVSFVSAQKIRSLNRKYRHKDTATDVLSFAAAPMPVPPNRPQPLGEIFVCASRARRQASAYGHSLERETAYLIVHGVLHLLGHDHERHADDRRMRAAAEAIMKALELTR